MDDPDRSPRRDVKPDLDPTRATIDLVSREIANLRFLTDVRIAAIEKAADVFAENLNRMPSTLDLEISKLGSLVGEKFANIQLQFHERDQRMAMEKQTSTAALNAALAAEKEATHAQTVSNQAAANKAEAATTKQIDSILMLLAGNKNAMDDKITAINSRLDRGDGSTGARQTGFSNSTSIIAIIVAGLGLLVSATNAIRSIAASDVAQQRTLTFVPTQSPAAPR